MSNDDVFFDLIDRIVCLDVGGRGVAGLFEPARALVNGSLSLAAANKLALLQSGDTVFILTGSLTRASVSPKIAENDGPIGSAILARALSLGFNAIPVIIVDASICNRVAKMVEFSGLNVVSYEQAKAATSLPRFTGIAVMENGAIEDKAARQAAIDLLNIYAPRAVVACERAGISADGTYRNALGQDYSEGREKLDYIVKFASERGLPTIGIGDGGSSNDPQGNGPNKNTLLATLLRLDVNATDGTYDAPAGNITDGAPEIFDWGLRNPYRWSFDVCTGDRYIADVGQNAWEEVDVAPASQGATNWGWDCREGANDFGQSTNGCPFGDEVDPVWQYQHVGGGRSITGGYVYRGQAIPWLRGWYFFGDFVTGEVWRFQWDNGPVANVVDVTNVGGQRLTGFGQDNQGEVYVVDATGTIFQVTAQ